MLRIFFLIERAYLRVIGIMKKNIMLAYKKKIQNRKKKGKKNKIEDNNFDEYDKKIYYK